MDENVKKFETIMEMISTKESIDSFVKTFEKVLTVFEKLKEANDNDRAGIQKLFNIEIDKLRARVASLKDGPAGRDGLDGKDGKDGLPGKDGRDGRDGVDGKIDSPDEIVGKINQSSLLIARERVDGLLDAIRMAAANAVSAGVGVTTTLFFKNGLQVGRAKNINIIEGNNTTATLYQTGDQMNIELTSTASATGLTWVSDEVPSGSGTSFTIANTPHAGTFKLFRGGAKQQSGVGNDYTLTGTALTLATALVSGEILLCDYGY